MTLSYTSENAHELNEMIKGELTSLEQWLQGSKLSLNVLKGKVMIIGSSQKLKKISNLCNETPSFEIHECNRTY